VDRNEILGKNRGGRVQESNPKNTLTDHIDPVIFREGGYLLGNGGKENKKAKEGGRAHHTRGKRGRGLNTNQCFQKRKMEKWGKHTEKIKICGRREEGLSRLLKNQEEGLVMES